MTGSRSADVKFSHLALACNDISTTESFYARHFGFRRARIVPLGTDHIVFLKLDEMRLELFHARESRPFPAPAEDGPWFPCIRHLAFQVDDLEAQLAAMGQDAVIVLGPLRFDDFIPGWRSVWVTDPDGTIVEISQGYVDDTDSTQTASVGSARRKPPTSPLSDGQNLG